MTKTKPEDTKELNVEENAYTFVPYEENKLPLQSITEAIINAFTQFEVVVVTYINSNGTTHKQHFTKSKRSLYNKRKSTFELRSCVDGSLHTILASDIVQVQYPINSEQANQIIEEANASKTTYAKLSSVCSVNYDLANCFFDSQMQGQDYSKLEIMVLLEIPNITEYYAPSLETINRTRNKMITLLQGKLATEKENIQKEFKTLFVEKDTDIITEMDTILEFLTQTESETINKINNASIIEEMLEAWPVILGNII